VIGAWASPDQRDEPYSGSKLQTGDRQAPEKFEGGEKEVLEWRAIDRLTAAAL
jgi:hypothetical protein